MQLEQIHPDESTAEKSSALPLAMGLAVPAAAILAASRVSAQTQTVTDVLNFALTLEYLEAEFYTRAVATTGLIPASDRDVFVKIRDDENAHVALLRQALGAQAVAKPAFDFTAGGMFGDVFRDYNTFLLLAQGFEDTGVRAYKGQAPNLMTAKDVLTTALRIHSAEARHAAVVRRIRGASPWVQGSGPGIAALNAIYAGEANTTHLGVDVTRITFVPPADVTAAFDEPLTKQAVLDIASPFIAAPVTINFATPIGVLNYALALEQLEAAFYERVVSSFYTGASSEERTILQDLRDHEVAHREFFKTAIPALGGTPIPNLGFDFSAVDFTSRTSVLQTARTFEDLGVAAYNGAGRLLNDTTLLGLAGEIVSVEARHAAAIRDLLQPKTGAFAPNAFDPALPPAQVVAAAQPFIVNRINATNLPA